MRIITAIEATGRAGEEDQEYLILLHGAEKVEELKLSLKKVKCYNKKCLLFIRAKF